MTSSRVFPWLFLAAYATALVATLPHYGLTWDETAWFDWGDTLFQWVFDREESPPLKDPRDLYHYGAVPALAGSAFDFLFHQRLEWLSSDNARHLSNVLWAVMTATGIVVWGRSVIGNAGAALALALWMLLPRMWPHAHNNISDMPGAAGAIWAAWACWRITLQPWARARDYALWGALMGLAFSLRSPNVYFLGGALGLWMLWRGWSRGWIWNAFSLPGTVLALAVFLVTVKALNPYLWDGSVIGQVFMENPKAYLTAKMGKLGEWYGGTYFSGKRVPRTYPLWIGLISTPWLHQLALVSGLLRVRQERRRERPENEAMALWLILMAVAVGKHLTGMGNYDGERHFLEAFAPLCLAGAAGIVGLWDRIAARSMRWRFAMAAAGVLLATEPVATGLRVHPYQAGYFNPFIRPLEQAWRDYEPDYWAQATMEATEWLQERWMMSPPALAPVVAGTEAPHLARHYLRDTAHVKRMKRVEDLDRLQPGEHLLLARRWMHRRRMPESENCPEGFETLHRIRPDAKLPPLMYICRKPPP